MAANWEHTTTAPKATNVPVGTVSQADFSADALALEAETYATTMRSAAAEPAQTTCARAALPARLVNRTPSVAAETVSQEHANKHCTQQLEKRNEIKRRTQSLIVRLDENSSVVNGICSSITATYIEQNAFKAFSYAAWTYVLITWTL